MALEQRGLRSAVELAAGRPHGVRLRYMGGCRCELCRRANTEYERGRSAARKAGDWNGLVPAEAARAHLATLSSQGIGRRSVGDVSGVADSILVRIINRDKRTIRARTERAILAVTAAAAADHACIDAGPTWKLIGQLLATGYTKAAIASQLGQARPALQLGRHRVTVRNAFEVQRLFERWRAVDAAATLRLLDDLSREGYRCSRIEQLLRERAAKHGIELDLTVRKGHIRASAAELVRRLHVALTAVPGEEAVAA